MKRLRFCGFAHTETYAGGPRNRPPVVVGEILECDAEEAVYLCATYPIAFEIVPENGGAAAPAAPEADRAERAPSRRR